MDTLRQVLRPTEVPDTGLVCDLLWADPDADIEGWTDNAVRGVSFWFGKDVVSSFLEKHGLDLIVRAHQVVQDGYEFFADRKLLTIFSAPLYATQFDNAGGFLKIDRKWRCSLKIFRRVNDTPPDGEVE